MKWKIIGVLSVIIFIPGCALLPRLSTKPTVPQNVQRSVVTRTTKPRIVVSRPNEQVTVVANEEKIETVVEQRETPKEVTKRSIWSRWWWWLLLLGGTTYLGLWPVLIKLARKLKERTHALTTVVGQVEIFKDEAKVDPQKGTVDQLKTILKSQDGTTKKVVEQIKNGKK